MNIKESHDSSQLALNIEMLRWAEDEIRMPHDTEIVIPPHFKREDALHALEVAVVRKYSVPPAVLCGQGRDERVWSELGLWSIVICIFFAAVGFIYSLSRWLL